MSHYIFFLSRFVVHLTFHVTGVAESSGKFVFLLNCSIAHGGLRG